MDIRYEGKVTVGNVLNVVEKYFKEDSFRQGKVIVNFGRVDHTPFGVTQIYVDGSLIKDSAVFENSSGSTKEIFGASTKRILPIDYFVINSVSPEKGVASLSLTKTKKEYLVSFLDDVVNPEIGSGKSLKQIFLENVVKYK